MEKYCPKVSILMGIYNCENTLVESIESIVNQDYENWELIICDDASKDSSFNIAKNYSNRYPEKIRVLRNEKNLTLGPTLNKCLRSATGKYIARHDGDDTCERKKLEIQVEFLKNNLNIDLVGTAMSCFDENGHYGVRKLKHQPEGRDLMKGTTFAHATIMIKAEVMMGLGGYSEENNAKGVEDYELWFRFFEKGYKGYNLENPLYNVREDRECYKRKNYKRRINEIKTMYKGRKLLELDLNQNKYLLKPMIATIVPGRILMSYHKNKLKRNIDINNGGSVEV
ncbi:glycosyltransferase family 2 protein [Clostridium sp.]|uniref:glycosyltransferase family 2 protein n=1 Tax=Clostridium sp. TaxID=1506 RepID=UPI003217E0A2